MLLGAPTCRRLEGKVCVVTASTAGIGLGIVRRLASEVRAVGLASRQQPTAAKLCLAASASAASPAPLCPEVQHPATPATLQGARVVVSSRRQQNVEEAVRQLRSEGLQVAGTACHVGDRAQLQKLIQFTLDTFGGLDILVSNAAVNPASGPIMTMEVSWRQLAAAGGGRGW